jgi:hypothetical protein
MSYRTKTARRRWRYRRNPTGRRGLVSAWREHWHGAAPTTAMTHIAIQEALDGKVVDWMEHVSDEQYRA